MGYKPLGKIYNLEFADFPGLEVSAKACTLAELTYVSQLTPDVREKDPEKRLELFHFFVGKLLSWNIEHPETNTPGGACANCGLTEGQPMPTTVDSVLCLELSLVMAIIVGWVLAQARVSVPKELNLNSGGNDTLTENVMKELEKLQNPPTLPQPNFI